MNNRFRLVCLVFALLWANTSFMKAQSRYQSDLLARMAESLKLSAQLDTLKDGIYKSDFFYKKRPLNVFVEHGRVSHIGYRVFTNQQRAASNSPVYNFLERYALENDLPLERTKSVSKQLAEDGINFSKGSMSELRALAEDSTLGLTVNNLYDKQYKVSWHKDGKLHYSVDFPIGYDLLCGTEMVENERRIAEDIKSEKLLVAEPLKVKREQLLTTWQPNYFILPGESYYVDALNTNRYYEKQSNGQFSLIFNPKYPLESLANLLTTLELKTDFNVNVRLRKYDYQEDKFDVPVSQFVSYFLRQGGTPYFGVISNDGTTAVCELVVRNSDLGYCHAMKVTFNVEQLAGKKGVMDVRLTCFVPTSKIKFLFEELKK